jgi:PAS domain S-box-containing protein
MMNVLKILLLEDSAYDAEIIKNLLLKEEEKMYEFNLAMNEEEFLAALDKFKPDIVLSDNSLPQFNATEALKIVREHSLYIPFILVTGTVSDEFAASIIKQGADDYVLKDRLTRLPTAIDGSLKQRQVEKQRLEAVNKLKESNDRYEIVAKATSDTIWDWDLATNKIIWNKNIQNIFGYKDIDLVTTNQWRYDKIHPADIETVHKNTNTQINDKILRYEDEYRFLCADGSYKYVYDRSFLVINSDGIPIRMIGAMQDITRQKQEEFRLKLLESVITNATDSVLITEAGTFDEAAQKIVYVNEAFTKMTGYKKEEVIGKTSRLLQGAKTNKEELEKLAKSMQKGESCEIEVIKYNKKGEEFWVQKAVAPVEDAEGNITHFISIERDVTERKLIDQKITKAIISAQDQERFQIGSELHDNVTQILAGTLISLGMINKNQGLPNGELFIKQCHDYIIMAIDEIRQLSHRLAPVFFKEETLKDTFERLLKTMNVDNKYKVRLYMDSFEAMEISNDIQLNLYRILQEQLNNIVKYSGATMVEISVLLLEKNLQMTIHDNGKGFDTNAVRTGIGLRNIQKRTELFLGSFLLTSSTGNGCTLTVEIPLQDNK